jgi:DNA-binding NarL/FixJ family response regulator
VLIQSPILRQAAPQRNAKSNCEVNSKAALWKSVSKITPTSLRVLVVDDQPSTLLLMRAILESEGHHVVESLTGLEAVNLLLTNEFDLVILDLNLSDMTAMELLQSSWLASKSLPPVLGITAAPSPEVVEKATAAGMYGVLPKPISRVQLVEATAAAIEVGWMQRVVNSGPVLDSGVLTQVGSSKDRGLLQRFVQQAVTDARHCVEELALANENSDFATWGQQAQALNGVALTLGARRLAGAVSGALVIPPRQLAHIADSLTHQFRILLDEAEHSIYEQLKLLSGRERSCLHLCADGLTMKQIAHELAISEHTVKMHMNNAVRKLGAHSRTQAVAKALELGAI